MDCGNEISLPTIIDFVTDVAILFYAKHLNYAGRLLLIDKIMEIKT
jgi:hypothetical protein